jgi:hypothetical protein
VLSLEGGVVIAGWRMGATLNAGVGRPARQVGTADVFHVPKLDYY